MRKKASTLTDIECEIRIERPNSYLIYDGKKTAWFPKSLVQKNDDDTVTMPLWLAKDRGFA